MKMNKSFGYIDTNSHQQQYFHEKFTTIRSSAPLSTAAKSYVQHTVYLCSLIELSFNVLFKISNHRYETKSTYGTHLMALVMITF